MKTKVFKIISALLTVLFIACNPNEDTGENLTPSDLLDPIDNSHDVYFIDNNTLYGVRDNNDPSIEGVGQMEAFMQVSIPSSTTTISTPLIFDLSENRNMEAGAYGPKKIVVASRDGTLYLYDVPSGELVWSSYLNGELRNTPSIISFADGNAVRAYLYIGNASGTFFCVDANDGNVVWSYEDPNGAAFENSTSNSRVNITCVATSTGTIYTFGREGNLIWSFDTLNLMQGKPILNIVRTNNGLDYELDSVLGGTIDGNVFRLNGNTGREIWSQNIGATIVSAPILTSQNNGVGSGNMYVTSLNREIYEISLNDGSIIWSTELDASIYASPARKSSSDLSTDNTLLVNTQKTLYALDAITGGNINWSLPLDPPMYSTPNIVPSFNNGSGIRCYVNTIQGLYGINAETGVVFSQFPVNSNQPIEGENQNFQSSSSVIYVESEGNLAEIYNPNNTL